MRPLVRWPVCFRVENDHTPFDAGINNPSMIELCARPVLSKADDRRIKFVIVRVYPLCKLLYVVLPDCVRPGLVRG
jgi:hypothetical protein